MTLLTIVLVSIPPTEGEATTFVIANLLTTYCQALCLSFDQEKPTKSKKNNFGT